MLEPCLALHRANTVLLISAKRERLDHIWIAEHKRPPALPIDLLKTKQLRRREHRREGVLNLPGHFRESIALLLCCHLPHVRPPAARAARLECLRQRTNFLSL